MKPVTTRSVRYRAVVDNDSQARRLPTSIVDQGVRNAIAANGARCLYDRGNVSYSIVRVWIFFSFILERKEFIPSYAIRNISPRVFCSPDVVAQKGLTTDEQHNPRVYNRDCFTDNERPRTQAPAALHYQVEQAVDREWAVEGVPTSERPIARHGCRRANYR